MNLSAYQESGEGQSKEMTTNASLPTQPSRNHVKSPSKRPGESSEGQAAPIHGDSGTGMDSEEDFSDASVSDTEAIEAARSLTEFAVACKGGLLGRTTTKTASPAERLARQRLRKRRNAVQSRRNKKARLEALRSKCEELTEIEARLLRKREVLRTKIDTLRSMNSELEESHRLRLRTPAPENHKCAPARNQGPIQAPEPRSQICPSVATGVVRTALSQGPGDFTGTGISTSYSMQLPISFSGNLLLSPLVGQCQEPQRTPSVGFYPWISHSSIAHALQGAPQAMNPMQPHLYSRHRRTTERSQWAYDQSGVYRGPVYR